MEAVTEVSGLQDESTIPHNETIHEILDEHNDHEHK